MIRVICEKSIDELNKEWASSVLPIAMACGINGFKFSLENVKGESILVEAKFITKEEKQMAKKIAKKTVSKKKKTKK